MGKLILDFSKQEQVEISIKGKDSTFDYTGAVTAQLMDIRGRETERMINQMDIARLLKGIDTSADDAMEQVLQNITAEDIELITTPQSEPVLQAFFKDRYDEYVEFAEHNEIKQMLDEAVIEQIDNAIEALSDTPKSTKK